MITLKAYAKINLTLDITGKRDDGYHLLRTLMQTVTLCDIITIRRQSAGIRITCNKPYIPTDARNVAYKAATAFFERNGIDGGVSLNLKKHIPCGAGLGGGSSDAAAVINGLCELYGVTMSAAQKAEMTADIGADIPFFFYGGTSLCEGIGERVTPISPLPECWFVISKPPVSMSTSAVFKSPSISDYFGGDSTSLVLDALQNEGVTALKSARNALEPISISMCAKIGNLKELMSGNGAIMSMMSGSGSAVFGVFTSHKSASTAYDKIKLVCRETYIAKPVQP